MRRPLNALTTRGRSFVAAGLTAIVCAFVLGERDLLRAGMLVIALPLLSLLAVSRTHYRLTCARRVTPARLPVGHEIQVDLRLENISVLPTSILLVEDHVPYTLGERARFVIDRIEPRGAREMRYRVRSDIRGRYRIGPLTVRVADPFGLVEFERAIAIVDRIIVTPPIVTLEHGRLIGSWTGGGESRARTVAIAGEDDIAPREYRHGDDLRRVHWRSTARHGELMVRREEQQWQNRGTLFLDTRRYSYFGEGPGSTFEQAVSAAASIGVLLGREGFGLRFVTDAGEALRSAAAFEGALLDMLAVVRPSANRTLRSGLTALRGTAAGDGGGDGLVIGVFGVLSPGDAREVALTHRGGSTRIAVLIDPGSATADPSADTLTSARLLRAARWRVVTIASASSLATAWAHAGRSAEGIEFEAIRNRTSPGGTPVERP